MTTINQLSPYINFRQACHKYFMECSKVLNASFLYWSFSELIDTHRCWRLPERKSSKCLFLLIYSNEPMTKLAPRSQVRGRSRSNLRYSATNTLMIVLRLAMSWCERASLLSLALWKTVGNGYAMRWRMGTPVNKQKKLAITLFQSFSIFLLGFI